jgi:glycerol-3-phosphate acyltransferase PlsY
MASDDIVTTETDISYTRESLRKATHLLAIVIPVTYLFTDRQLVLPVLIAISATMILLETARLRGWKMWALVAWVWEPLIRPNEAGRYTGASYILVAAIITVVLFDKSVAVCALSFVILGDTAGALVGRRWGRVQFRNKTLEGSSAFFVVSLLPAFILSDSIPLWIGAIGAFVATLTEALSSELDDNLSVPLISGLIMHLLVRLTS